MVPSVGGNPNGQSAKWPNGLALRARPKGIAPADFRPRPTQSPGGFGQTGVFWSRSTAAISFIMGSSSANRCTIASFTPDAT